MSYLEAAQQLIKEGYYEYPNNDPEIIANELEVVFDTPEEAIEQIKASSQADSEADRIYGRGNWKR